jgi:uncharacterized protein
LKRGWLVTPVADVVVPIPDRDRADSFDLAGLRWQNSVGAATMADPALHDDSAPAVRLRGHTILCLQGFRGEGYSPGFIENMAAIHEALTNHPESWVEILASPDTVCAACPHRNPSGCTLNGAQSEEEMIAQDHVVIKRLGLQVGSRIRWLDILERIRQSVAGDDLPSICGSCRWLPLGYCREGITRLRKSIPGLAIGPLSSKPFRD